MKSCTSKKVGGRSSPLSSRSGVPLEMCKLQAANDIKNEIGKLSHLIIPNIFIRT